jgi:competence protein ComEC
VLSLALVVSVAVWLARHHPGAVQIAGLAMALLGGVVRRWRLNVILVACAVIIAGVCTQRSWAAFRPAPTQPVSGWATVVSDPQRVGSMVVVIVLVGARRERVRAFGSVARRLERRRAGERVWIAGRQRALSPVEVDRLAPQHVRASLGVDVVGDSSSGSPLAVATNRIRELLTHGSAMMGPSEQALYLGLIIGDDHAEPPAIIADFRSAGLSHLTAVSGQNVAFLLIACSPVLRRLRPGGRWAATIGLVLWFAALTRFEPSVLRAAGMALLAATAFWRGWSATPRRLLSLTVTALLLIDPLLAWSVGWWLSVGATMGLALLAKPLLDRLPGPRWIAAPVAATLAAQTGIAPISFVVFGRSPLISVFANLLAVPVAGMVMVWGIPAGVLAGLVHPIAAVVQLPSRIGTRWVLIVARLAARVEPSWTGRWGVIVQLAAVGGVLVFCPSRDTPSGHPFGRSGA